MNRRGFLGVLVAVVAAPFVPYKPIGLGLSGLSVGIIGGINRETFTFWRNQPAIGVSGPVTWDRISHGVRKMSGGSMFQVPLSYGPKDRT